MRIGVLALQGGFAAHERALADLGHETLRVRDGAAFERIDGLVLPGGESSAMLRLIDDLALAAPLHRFFARARPILATCAGLILAARGVSGPSQRSLGWLDVDVVRNGYGRQLDSFAARSDDGRERLIFIRAPRIARVGPGVEVLARHRGEPVMVRQAQLVGACFHPELDDSRRVHALVFGDGRHDSADAPQSPQHVLPALPP